jgi:hypothetical protein
MITRRSPMKLAKAKRVHVQTTCSLLKLYNMLEFEKALLRQGLFYVVCLLLIQPINTFLHILEGNISIHIRRSGWE